MHNATFRIFRIRASSGALPPFFPSQASPFWPGAEKAPPPSSFQPSIGVGASTPSGNSGDIYLADSPVGTEGTIRYAIGSGKEQMIRISDLAMLYAHGTKGATVSIFAEVE